MPAVATEDGARWGIACRAIVGFIADPSGPPSAQRSLTAPRLVLGRHGKSFAQNGMDATYTGVAVIKAPSSATKPTKDMGMFDFVIRDHGCSSLLAKH